MSTPSVFIGTDSGATTSKTGGVWADGSPISTQLRQSSTNSQDGTAAVVKGWVEGVEGFLADKHWQAWLEPRPLRIRTSITRGTVTDLYGRDSTLVRAANDHLVVPCGEEPVFIEVPRSE